MENVDEEQPDTLPGFKMQSENFVLKFVTGLQKGVCRCYLKQNLSSKRFIKNHNSLNSGMFSKLLEYETDWFDMMEIILSRLEDEPSDQDNFQVIKSSVLCLPIVCLFYVC